MNFGLLGWFKRERQRESTFTYDFFRSSKSFTKVLNLCCKYVITRGNKERTVDKNEYPTNGKWISSFFGVVSPNRKHVAQLLQDATSLSLEKNPTVRVRENMWYKTWKMLSFFCVCIYRGKKREKKSDSDHHRHGDWQLVGFVTFVVSTVSANFTVDEFYCSVTIFFLLIKFVISRLFFFVCCVVIIKRRGALTTDVCWMHLDAIERCFFVCFVGDCLNIFACFPLSGSFWVDLLLPLLLVHALHVVLLQLAVDRHACADGVFNL